MQLVAGGELPPARHDPGADPRRAAVQRCRHAHPDRVQVGRGHPGGGEPVADHRGGAVQRVDAVLVDVEQVVSPRPARRRRGRRPPPARARGRCRPRRPRRAGVLSATSSGGRPLPPLCGRPRSSVSTTSPARIRSATRLETVVRERPVPRARSARLIGPSPASSPATVALVALAQPLERTGGDHPASLGRFIRKMDKLPGRSRHSALTRTNHRSYVLSGRHVRPEAMAASRLLDLGKEKHDVAHPSRRRPGRRSRAALAVGLVQPPGQAAPTAVGTRPGRPTPAYKDPTLTTQQRVADLLAG